MNIDIPSISKFKTYDIKYSYSGRGVVIFYKVF